MKIIKAKSKDFDRILEFFELVEKEFVPPLSERGSLEERIKKILFSKDGSYVIMEDERGEIIALSGFIKNYQGNKNHAYLTFFSVKPVYRKKGLGISFRKKIMKILKKDGIREVHTRTWSTNKAMLKINKEMGFKVEKIVKNERGNNIDSIYLKKET